MGYQEQLAVVKELNHAFRCYKSIESLFELDQWSALPPEGAAYRQQVGSFVADQKNALFASPGASEAFAYFSGGIGRTLILIWKEAWSACFCSGTAMRCGCPEKSWNSTTFCVLL